MTFSLCMIVRNEERTLKRCLDSVAGVFDEIVIVDTGSADRTKVVAKAYTDKVYDFARGVTTFPQHEIFRFQKQCATT